MPDVLGAPPSPRTALLWNGTAWQWALVDAAGHLQIDVQTILGLDGALQSVAADRLIVRGEDQLFSIDDILMDRQRDNNAAAGDNTLTSGVCPAGEIWVVTHAVQINLTSAITRMECYADQGAQNSILDVEIAPAQYVTNKWDGHLYLKEGGFVVGLFVGCILNDTIIFDIHGYKMTLET